jgi:hypothetical protein
MLTPDDNGAVIKMDHKGYTTDIITEKSLEWLKNSRESGKPFLLMCQHKAHSWTLGSS